MFFGFGLQFARTGHTLALSARVARMFVNGEQGAWYDPSDMTTLFQDTAGTVPVTATGQTVGRINDKSGNGNHATQAAAGSRPMFRDVGGLRYLEFDGLDDFLVTAAINFTATDKMSVFAGVRKLSDAATGIISELSTTSDTNNGAFALVAPTSTLGGGSYSFNLRGTIRAAGRVTGFPAPISNVLAVQYDISQTAQANEIVVRVNSNSLAHDAGNNAGTGNFGNYPLYIGLRGAAFAAFNGHLYGLLIRGSLTSTASIIATERFMATKSGVVIP